MKEEVLTDISIRTRHPESVIKPLMPRGHGYPLQRSVYTPERQVRLGTCIFADRQLVKDRTEATKPLLQLHFAKWPYAPRGFYSE